MHAHRVRERRLEPALAVPLPERVNQVRVVVVDADPAVGAGGEDLREVHHPGPEGADLAPAPVRVVVGVAPAPFVPRDHRLEEVEVHVHPAVVGLVARPGRVEVADGQVLTRPAALVLGRGGQHQRDEPRARPAVVVGRVAPDLVELARRVRQAPAARGVGPPRRAALGLLDLELRLSTDVVLRGGRAGQLALGVVPPRRVHHARVFGGRSSRVGRGRRGDRRRLLARLADEVAAGRDRDRHERGDRDRCADSQPRAPGHRRARSERSSDAPPTRTGPTIRRTCRSRTRARAWGSGAPSTSRGRGTAPGRPGAARRGSGG